MTEALAFRSADISAVTGEFVDKVREAGFVAYDWPQVSRQIRVAALIGGPVFLLLGYTDYAALGTSSAFYQMVVVRIGVCLAALAFALALRRFDNPTFASFGVFLMSVLIAGGFVIGVMIKQQGAEFRSATIMALVLIYYFFVPNRLLIAAAAAIFASIFYITVLIAIGAQAAEIIYITLMLSLLNVLGYYYKKALGTARRQEYDSRHREQQRNEQLEAARGESERARARAEEANTSKSRFMANMSHELRTPLNAIIGFSEIMSRQLLGPLGQPRYVEYADDVLQAGQHLLDLINDVLDLAKIEAGKTELHPELIDLSSLIFALRRLVEVQAKDAGLKLTMSVPATCPVLTADYRAVKQILLNVLSNAMKFTSPEGAIALDVRQRAGGGIDIVVSDTGVGIAPADLERVFAPFEQVHLEMPLERRGTGLGLALVKAMMELHGGTVTISSQVSVGTTVTLHFPDSATAIIGRSSSGKVA
jgi:signal transduction histidine kinase